MLLVLVLLLSAAPQSSGSAPPASSGTGAKAAQGKGSASTTTSRQGCTYPTGWLPTCASTQGVGMPLISSASPWQPVASPHGPPDSGSPYGAMAYDPADGYMVLVTWNWTSGADETWELTSGGWAKLPIASPPLSLSTLSPSMVFDPEAPGTSCFVGTSGCLVLLMGHTNDSEYEWQYAAGAWTNVTSRAFMIHGPWTQLGLIYDPNGSDCINLHGCLIAVSGMSSNESWACGLPCYQVATKQQTWEYNPALGGWENVNSAVGPAWQENVLGSQYLFYDPVQGHAFLETPVICDPPPTTPGTVGPTCGGTSSLLYMMSAQAWAPLLPGCTPSITDCSSGLLGLLNAGGAFDAANRFYLVFGGAYSSNSAENTTWSFYGDNQAPVSSSWIDVSQFAGLGTGGNPQPDQRVDPLMAYDPNPADCGATTPSHGCVYLFGGADCPASYCFVDDLSDTWRFWLPVTPGIYAQPAKVTEGTTLYLNVTVIGGTGRYIWYNRSWVNNYDPNCPANTIYDDLHSRVTCVVSLPNACPGSHGNLFNVTVAVTDSANEVGDSGPAMVEVDPAPFVTHFYARYPVVWPGINLGQLFPVSAGVLANNYGIVTWARSWSYSDPNAWRPVSVSAYLVVEGTALPVQTTTWDNFQAYYVSLSTLQESSLALNDQIVFDVTLGPSGTSCATVSPTLDLNSTYGSHHLPSFPVGLGGQFGAVDPGSMLSGLINELPTLVYAQTASTVLTTWGDQGGHGSAQAFNATWFVNSTLTLDLKSIAKASLPDPVSGAAAILPKVALSLSFSSIGKVTMTAATSWKVPLGKLAGIDFKFVLTLTAQAKFQIEQTFQGFTSVGSLVLTNFSVALTVAVLASVTFPIYGISLGPLGTIGLTMTIGFSIAVGLSLWFQSAKDPTQYFLGWLPVVLIKLEALIAVAVSVSVGLSLGIASINFGGTAEFDIYLQSVGPLLRGMDLIGTVFVKVQALFWSWTDNIWQGVLYSEGNPTPGLAYGPASGGTFVPGNRYYNVTGYQSVIWATGASQGPLVQDLYPGGSWDLAPSSGSAYLLFGSDNVSMPLSQGLDLQLLRLDTSSRTATPVQAPSVPGELAFNPRLTTLPDGSLLALWNALPGSEAASATGPSDLTHLLLRSAVYDPATGTWGSPSVVVPSGFPVSFAGSGCGTLGTVLYLESPTLFAHGGDLVEVDRSTGGVLANVSAPGAATVLSFDCASGLASVQNYDGSTTVWNLSSGSSWAAPSVGGHALAQETTVSGGHGDLALLYRNASDAVLLVQTPGGRTIANVTLPENTSTVELVNEGGTFVVSAGSPDGVSVGLLSGGALYPVRSYLWRGLIQQRLAVSSNGVATVVGESQGGTGAAPWENLSSAFVPLTSVPTLTASPPVADAGVPVTFRANVTTVNAPLQYAWSGLPPGCASLDQPALTCTPAAPGTYPIQVQVTDALGDVASSPVLSFAVLPPISVGAATASPATVEVGSALALSVPPPAGATGLSYAWNGLPPGCSSLDEESFTCFPTAPGNYTVGVTVSDASGSSASSAPVLVEVVPALALSALTPSSDPIYSGTSTTLSALVSGGVAPFTYAWAGLPSGCGVPQGATTTCTFPSSGTYLVSLVVTDARGAVTFGSSQVQVETAPAPPAGAPFLLLLAGLAAVAVANVAIWWWPARKEKEG